MIGGLYAQNNSVYGINPACFLHDLHEVHMLVKGLIFDKNLSLHEERLDNVEHCFSTRSF